VYIRRSNPDGSTEERLAEILSIRERQTSAYAARRRPGGIDPSLDNLKPEDKLEYFVHWEHFNKRLDDWVAGSRLVLSRDLEWPKPKAPPQPKKAPTTKIPPGKIQKGKKKHKTGSGSAGVGTPLSSAPPPKTQRAGKPVPPEYADYSPTPTPAPQTPTYSPIGPETPLPISSIPLKRKADEDEESMYEEDAEGEMDVDAEGEVDAEGDPDADGEVVLLDDDGPTEIEPPPPVHHFSKEVEIEKLRTSGSMTQSISEIARVKNLNRIQMGKHEVEAWYFSPYPQEYAHLPVLYICEYCLSYFGSQFMLGRHRTRCTLLHPPGNEIYRHDDISFFEIDGKRQLTWCRNLSLLSKCFLDQ
jgi:histone acetyltransferase HTATIP